jgi:hypothetical protein
MNIQDDAKHMQKIKPAFLLTVYAILLLATLALCTGCTGEQGTVTPVPTTTISATPTVIIPSSTFETNTVKLEERFRPDGSRYHEAIVDVHNTASVAQKDVTILFILVDTETGEERSRQTQYVQYFDPGETKQWTKNLESDAGRTYRLDVSVIAG